MMGDWEYQKLGKVCRTGAGGTPLKSKKEYYLNGDIPWLRSGEVNNRNIIDCEIKITEKGLNNSSAKLFPPKTVLIAMYGATAGQVGILNFECATNQAVCGVLPNENFVPEFLYYFFLKFKDELIAQAVGNAQPNISQEKIKDTLVPIIPISDQQEIVALLDQAFEAIDQAKANAERNLQNAKELFESYLQGVFENKGDDWVTTQLINICEEITDGSHFSPQSSSNGAYPYITVRDIDNDVIDFDNCKFINKSDYNSLCKNGCKPNSGDLLFSKDGTVGKVSLVNYDKEFVVLSSLAIIRPKKKTIDSTLLKYILKDPTFLAMAIGMKTGAAIRRIILKNLKTIDVSFPRLLVEQTAIVARLDKIAKETEKLANIYVQKIANLEELKKSILQKAFAGELTNKTLAL